MAAVRSLVATQLLATVIMALVKAVAGWPDVFESGLGALAKVAWVVLSLVAWLAAAIKAHDNQQQRWLVGIILFWPLMYPFAFKYAQPSRY